MSSYPRMLYRAAFLPVPHPNDYPDSLAYDRAVREAEQTNIANTRVVVDAVDEAAAVAEGWWSNSPVVPEADHDEPLPAPEPVPEPEDDGA